MKILSSIGKGTAYEYAAKLRQRIFVEEQGFHNEFDEIDETALHLVLLNDQGEEMATARAYKNAPVDKEYHIGRVAVDQDYRGTGLGAKVMLAIEEELKKLGAESAVLSAQCQAEGFYNNLGYISFGEVYLDEHCPHQDMRKVL